MKTAIAAMLLMSAAVALGQSSSDGPQVKKSKTGICHEKGSTFYERTKNYTPYPSMDACIKSGGRPPKR